MGSERTSPIFSQANTIIDHHYAEIQITTQNIYQKICSITSSLGNPQVPFVSPLSSNRYTNTHPQRVLPTDLTAQSEMVPTHSPPSQQSTQDPLSHNKHRRLKHQFSKTKKIWYLPSRPTTTSPVRTGKNGPSHHLEPNNRANLSIPALPCKSP